jgi:hypothetical protein
MGLPRRNKEEDRRCDGESVMINYVLASTFGDIDYLMKIVPVGVIRPLRPIPQMVFVHGEQGIRLLNTIQLMNGKDS